eukprot:m.311228 g.311228  ORF g.311228 m.311228 type:complete len:485 (+) comp62856_c0_seq1:35-1489(+)
MANFSSALRLADLNDFITPSQECIMPIKVSQPPKKGTRPAKIVIEGEDYVQEDSLGERTPLAKAQITLNDCLACSGCITSAESVLIAKQSHEEMIHVFTENKTKRPDDPTRLLLIVSISPQSAASIAARYGLSDEAVTAKLTSLFKRLGADHVFDLSIAIEMSLIESARQFVDRAVAADARETGHVPMLASTCPGWVCYAEKSHGSYILPHICTAKSPQQIMGSLVKYHFSQKLGKSPDKVYHVTVMPCYDRKLEASRSDFYGDVYRTRDIDCVVTSLEIEKLIEDQGIDISCLPDCIPDAVSSKRPARSLLGCHHGSGTDGFLAYILYYAAKELYHCSVKELSVKTLRNKDFREVTIVPDDDTLAPPPLKFAAVYGFRNIQTLVQKIKRRKCEYQFVEVMACPSACLNGGGQIRPQVGETAKETLSKVESLYLSEGNRLGLDEAVKEVYDLFLGGMTSKDVKSLLHTQYHAVEKAANSFAVKW